MDYNLKANEENIKLFKRHFLITDNEKEIYTCVLCGRKTSISYSTSLGGHKLICCGCVYDKFDGDYAKAREWQKE